MATIEIEGSSERLGEIINLLANSTILADFKIKAEGIGPDDTAVLIAIDGTVNL